MIRTGRQPQIRILTVHRRLSDHVCAKDVTSNSNIFLSSPCDFFAGAATSGVNLGTEKRAWALCNTNIKR